MNWNDVIERCKNAVNDQDQRLQRSEVQWRELLSPEVFAITRNALTERPFSSSMCNAVEAGRYQCACCQTLLFDTEAKFDSGTGWPSFTEAVDDKAIFYQSDESAAMQRVEINCARCDAHLGHVFPDGPAPSGLRYCVNALALIKTPLDQ